MHGTGTRCLRPLRAAVPAGAPPASSSRIRPNRSSGRCDHRPPRSPERGALRSGPARLADPDRRRYACSCSSWWAVELGPSSHFLRLRRCRQLGSRIVIGALLWVPLPRYRDATPVCRCRRRGARGPTGMRDHRPPRSPERGALRSGPARLADPDRRRYACSCSSWWAVELGPSSHFLRLRRCRQLGSRIVIGALLWVPLPRYRDATPVCRCRRRGARGPTGMRRRACAGCAAGRDAVHR